jgi:DmsE family decaheme c-type cytochrome
MGVLREKPRIRRLLWLAAPVLLIAGSVSAGTPPADAVAVGTETCMGCHDQIGEEFHNTVHGRAYWAQAADRKVGCESCHGPGSAHAEEGDPALIFNPGDTGDPDNARYCVQCHTDMRAGATFKTAHYEITGGCADCHSLHSTVASVKKPDPQLCMDCHTDVRAKMTLPSHHPLLEGYMQCMDCHDPHGKEKQFTASGDDRELCFGCHPQHQGPYVFEHAPVNEDCRICHDPHGAVTDNLLVQAEPTLCLSCHPTHFHTQLTGYDGEFDGAPLHADRGGVSALDSFKSAMMTKCTQCHNSIHGTDESAQSITDPAALTR